MTDRRFCLWQTPAETRRLKHRDHRDQSFFFASSLPWRILFLCVVWSRCEGLQSAVERCARGAAAPGGLCPRVLLSRGGVPSRPATHGPDRGSAAGPTRGQHPLESQCPRPPAVHAAAVCSRRQRHQALACRVSSRGFLFLESTN